MLTHMLKPIATHTGEGWNKDEKTTVFIQDEYTIIEIEDRKRRQIIRFRNCAELNKDAAIQFTVEEIKFDAKRGGVKYITFSIPASMAELFIQRLSVLK
jgi:hypothetical protein